MTAEFGARLIIFNSKVLNRKIPIELHYKKVTFAPQTCLGIMAFLSKLKALQIEYICEFSRANDSDELQILNFWNRCIFYQILSLAKNMKYVTFLRVLVIAFARTLNSFLRINKTCDHSNYPLPFYIAQEHFQKNR